MEYHYSIKEGELLLDNSRKNRMVAIAGFLFRLLKLFMLLFSFCITMYVTYLIFRECIVEATLSNCIPLGSIFATFGSAVISVISLFCNKQISFFQENLSALHEQITGLSSWKRWPFLKRHSRERVSLWKYNYYTLHNPQITFNSEELCLTIALPTCTADFYDIPIVYNTFKMLGFHKNFSKSLAGHHKIQDQKDIFVFYCTMMIYRNIIRYKTGTFFMLVGSEFVLASIIFSFFYVPVQEVMLRVSDYVRVIFPGL